MFGRKKKNTEGNLLGKKGVDSMEIKSDFITKVLEENNLDSKININMNKVNKIKDKLSKSTFNYILFNDRLVKDFYKKTNELGLSKDYVDAYFTGRGKDFLRISKDNQNNHINIRYNKDNDILTFRSSIQKLHSINVGTDLNNIFLDTLKDEDIITGEEGFNFYLNLELSGVNKTIDKLKRLGENFKSEENVKILKKLKNI